MTHYLKTRTGAVLGGAIVLALLTGGGAVAGALVTSADIQNETIQKRDIGAGAVGSDEAVNGSLSMRDLDANTTSRINTDPSVAYIDRVLATTSTRGKVTPAPCPAGTQIITGFVIPGGSNAFYSLDGQYANPAKNAWMISMYTDAGEGTLNVRVVCLL